MAGNGSKKEKRRAKEAEKKEAAASSSDSITISVSDDVSDYINARNEGRVQYVAPEELYSSMNDTINEVPPLAMIMDGLTRNLIHSGTIPAFTRRLAALPCVIRKNLVLLQLLLVDEQKTAQLKLYAVGSRFALNNDDSDVVERSRKMFKDAAPSFMNDFGLWIYSRSLVRMGYNGSIDDAALELSPCDPLDSLDNLPMDSSAAAGGIRCAEIFMLFAIKGDVPGNLCSRETVLEFLNRLNSEEGIREIQAFTVTAGTVVATREKVRELRGSHVTA